MPRLSPSQTAIPSKRNSGNMCPVRLYLKSTACADGSRFEQNGIIDHTGGSHTFQEGVVLRADMTRIGGSYWNFTGYWRGRLNSSSNAFAEQTLNELLSRTYHIELTYNNPASRYTAGFGRLLLPWAPSLNTIDGGYFARRMAKHVTTGIFGGSTPDPTAWNYDPHRQMFGVFTSFDAGSFEDGRAIWEPSARPLRAATGAPSAISFSLKTISLSATASSSSTTWRPTS